MRVLLPLLMVAAGQQMETDHRTLMGAGLTHRDCYALEMIGAVWYYNWDAAGPGCRSEFVPLHYQGGGWPDQEYAPGNMLMFNEVNVPWQRRLEPELAAIEWYQAEREFPDTRLVGPNVAYDQDGLEWLEQWYAAYWHLYGQAPRIGAGSAHCYSYDVAECQAWLETLHAWFVARGAPTLWLTEFSFLPCWYDSGEAESIRRAGELVDWLRAQGYIERAAWFATHPMVYGEKGMWWPDGCQTPLADTRDLTEYGRWLREEIRQ